MLGIPIVTTFSGDGIKKAVQSFKQLESASDKAKFILKAGALAGVAAFAALGTAAFQAGQALLGFAKMAADDEKGQKQLALSIRASTKATDAQIAATEDWIDTTQRAVGVADDELRPAYARIIRSTKDFDKAQRLLRLALDVSAATGKPLQAVTEALSKAYDGSNTALTRLGLGYDKAKLKGMEFNDIQKDLEGRFGGSALENANTYEGVMARFAITIDELKESLGQAVLPYLKKLAEYGIQIADAFGRDGVAGAFEELQFILNTLLYDENGQLNAAGQQINSLADKLNFIINTVNRLIGAGAAGASAGLIPLAERITGNDFTPSIPNVSGFAPSINAGSLRGIRGSNSGVNITVQTGIGDPVQIGRTVYNTLNNFERRNGGR
jgi:hypothetical protein